MTKGEIYLKLSNIKIDNNNLDSIKTTGKICGKLRDDLVDLFSGVYIQKSIKFNLEEYEKWRDKNYDYVRIGVYSRFGFLFSELDLTNKYKEEFNIKP